MYVPDNSIIDNDKIKLSDELKRILKEQRVVDVASGYFNVRGFELIKDDLLNAQKFRLLLGRVPEKDDREVAVFNAPEFYSAEIRADMERSEFEKSRQTTVTQLIGFLKQDNVEVRLYGGKFLHGKTYIFDKLVIVGSSNFTYSGLTENTELNAVLTDVYADYVRKEWFEKFWKESNDFKRTFVEILEKSKFGVPRIPYEIYVKCLYELQKDDILAGLEPKKENFLQTKVNLAEFQEDAVQRIFSRLKKYNGILIADSVGLGKTWIAKRVIEEYGFFRRSNFLVICPAQLRDSLWVKALKDMGLSENIVTQEALGREDFNFNNIHRLSEVALIVIDESHNFRSPISNRYEKLFTLIEKATTETNKPKIVLLTATPINNTVWDLYYQLMLISRNDNRIFIKNGIYDLQEYFKEMDKKGTPALLNDILHEISIRRTRQYIREKYPDATINNEKIKFPERNLETVEYSLNDSYKGMYKLIADKIEKELIMAYYTFERYRLGEKDERITFIIGRMEALSAIFKTILLKRLESSVEAFRETLKNQIRFLALFIECLKKGKVLRKQYFNKFSDIFEEIEEFDDESLEKEISEGMEDINLDEYDKDSLFRDVNKDITIMQELLDRVKGILSQDDAKLVELKNRLLKIKDNGKILLFTFYADTLNYVYDALINDREFMAEFGKKIDKVYGGYSIKQRIEKIDGFLNKDVDFLMSTDLLSEGQNLQKAKSLINYDLHWNPTRMIQRAGRIDRIGSPYEVIEVYNFFPEDELNTLLRLVEILQRKIRSIDESVGLDASVLGEAINPKVFGVLKEIKDEKESVWDDLEKQQFGGGEIFWEPLRDFLKEKSFSYLDAIPYGAYSGLKKDYRGIFFYFKYGEDYHFWYLYDIANRTFLTHKSEILEFISCAKTEPVCINDGDRDIAFNAYKIVKEDIGKVYHENVIDAGIRPEHREKYVREILKELEYLKIEYFSEYEKADFYRDEIDKNVAKIREMNLTKKRLKDLRDIWRDYSADNNPREFFKAIAEFTEEKKVLKEETEEPFDEDKIELVCIDYIS